MANYHLSKNNTVARCTAKPGACPLNSKHFASKDAAEFYLESNVQVDEVKLPRLSFAQKRAARKKVAESFDATDALLDQQLPGVLDAEPTEKELDKVHEKLRLFRVNDLYQLPDGNDSARPSTPDPYKDAVRVAINHVLSHSTLSYAGVWSTDATATTRGLRQGLTMMPQREQLATVHAIKVLDRVASYPTSLSDKAATDQILCDLEMLYTRGA